ncbi:MAG TPA: LysM peptidoglycan-binding domain-containing protein [Thermoanaerobaculia bacterium]|nr:LysM peptidoglycan-binding domain-containing protein [Thermoanaerobaculia bacterium]
MVGPCHRGVLLQLLHTRIASRIGVTIEHLMTVSGLRSEILRAGQRLMAYVPA